ncbi:hypothetical protein CLU79DRAFT_739819 [Phycomyces nitens]|nr:hypothetical protein CLU79DRAFT_739819 [Phycomyces nitens]
MSILQATSLFMLHRQSMAFSIKDAEELSPEAIEAPLLENDSIDLEEVDEPVHDSVATMLNSVVIGIIASLLIGIWADYNAHSATQWLVLFWILSPIGSSVVYLFLLAFCRCFDEDVPLYVSCIPSAGFLIAATITGYLPK